MTKITVTEYDDHAIISVDRHGNRWTLHLSTIDPSPYAWYFVEGPETGRDDVIQFLDKAGYDLAVPS